MSKNMVLQGLVLRDFKKHEQLEVQFSPTVTAIRGPNYAGKSTVLQAIFFALFGATAVAGGKSAIVRHGAKNCSVELHMEIDGESAVLTRTATAATLNVAGNLVASGHTSVNSWIEDMFGMDQKSVLRLANSSQGETSALLTLGATALNRIIEEVANARYIDELMDRAGKIAADATSKLENLPPDEDVSDKEDQIETLERDMAKKDKEIAKHAKTVEPARTKHATAKTALSNAIAHNKKVQSALAEKRRIESDIEITSTTLRESMSELKLIQVPDVDALATAAKEAQTNHTTAAESTRRGAELRKRRTEHQGWLDTNGAKWSAAAAEFGPQVATLTEQKSTAESEARRLYAEVNAQKKQIEQMKADLANSSCPTCKRAFDEETHEHAKTAVAEAEERLKGLDTDYAKAKSKYNEVTAALSEAQAKLPPAGWEALAESRRNEIKQINDELEDTAEYDSDELAALAEASNLARDAHTKAVTAKTRHDDLERRCKTQREKLAALEEKLAGMEVGEEIDTEKLIGDERLAAEALQEVETKQSALTSERGLMKLTFDRLVELVARAKRVAELRKQYEGRAARFKQFQAWLRSNKATFMSETWDSLLSLVSEFVAQVTSNRVEQIGRSDDGTFWFVENGATLPVDGCASGGQKSIMGVGLRLALASLLPQGCRFVVLDEPSAELNDEHAAALAGALRAQERQVILVTHREGDEFASDAVISLY